MPTRTHAVQHKNAGTQGRPCASGRERKRDNNGDIKPLRGAIGWRRKLGYKVGDLGGAEVQIDVVLGAGPRICTVRASRWWVI